MDSKSPRTATPRAGRLAAARKIALSLAIAGVWLASAVAVASPLESAVAQEQREERRTFAASSGMTLDVENLAGEILVEGTGGGDIEVVATIHAESGDLADAEALLSAININFNERSGRVDIEVDYPVDRFQKYRYPQSGRGNNNTQTTYQDERVRVTSSDDDDAVTLYVDFVIRVPSGVAIDIENEVGDVSGTAMQGDFRAETGSGNVTVAGGTGDVEADTGSGDVVVSGIDGQVLADTGSGDVEVSEVAGDVSADTGSGDIDLSDIDAGRIEADTGSGTVHLQRVTGAISADTGSGDIIAEDITAGASITADTGSGDIRFAGDLSGARQIEIDTSSGDVELDMTDYPGMRITIETGSGSIDVDLPQLETVGSRRNYFRGEVGDGSAEVVIETGSGSVRLRSR